MSRVRMVALAAALLLAPSVLVAQTGQSWNEEQRAIADLDVLTTFYTAPLDGPGAHPPAAAEAEA